MLRNLTFDLVRCLMSAIAYPLIFEGPRYFIKNDFAGLASLGRRALLVAGASCLAHFIVKPSWFKNHPLAWSFIRMTYFGVRGPAVLNLCNRVELTFQGDFLPWLTLFFIEMHTTLGGNMIEEICCGGLGVNYMLGQIGCFYDNIESYISYALQLPTILIFQYFYRGFIFRS